MPAPQLAGLQQLPNGMPLARVFGDALACIVLLTTTRLMAIGLAAVRAAAFKIRRCGKFHDVGRKMQFEMNPLKKMKRAGHAALFLAAMGFGSHMAIARETDGERSGAKPHKILARITLYNGRGDRYGKKTATSGVLSQHGETAAADFQIIPQGSNVRIRELEGRLGNGTYQVVDTGTAVIQKKASRKMARHLFHTKKISEDDYREYRDAPVIDIFVDVSDQELNRMAGALPYFCEVEVCT